MEQEELLLESLEKETLIKRKKLLPLWIKIFIWIFIVFGVLGVLGFIAAIFSAKFEAALYGIETNDPSSAAGMLVCFLFVFKGVVAWGLWTEKRWAVDAAVADAILGIVVCATASFLPFNHQEPRFSFRLELVLLIPYLIKMLNIRSRWKQA